MRVMKVMKVMKAMKAKAGRRTIPSGTDPYLPWGGTRDNVVCKVCRAVYHHKRWYPEGEWSLKEEPKTPMGQTLCPACRKAHDHFAGGVLTLRGGFFAGHKDQILNLVRNEEARAIGVNPLERIIAIENGGDYMEIRTTSERMAQRIGREIQRAYKGDIVYRWSRDNKFVRVDWHRGEETGEAVSGPARRRGM